MAAAPASATCVATLTGHKDRVWCAAWSPKGTRLATCGGDQTIRVWEERPGGTWAPCDVLEGVHHRTVRALAWTPAGRHLASASFDGTVGIWEFPAEGSPGGPVECVAALEGHENEVKAVAWNAGGTLLGTCGRDKTVWVWERVEAAEATDGEFECAAVLRDHAQDVKAVRWHPHHDVLFSASYDDTVRAWACADGDWACAAVLRGHGSTVWGLAFSADGERLFSCSDDRTICVWGAVAEGAPAGEGEGGGTVETLAGLRGLPVRYALERKLEGVHSRTVYSIDCAGSPELLATAGADNEVRVLARAPNGAYEAWARIAGAHEGDVNCAAWRPGEGAAGGSRMLCTVGDDRCVRLWTVPLPP